MSFNHYVNLYCYHALHCLHTQTDWIELTVYKIMSRLRWQLKMPLYNMYVCELLTNYLPKPSNIQNTSWLRRPWVCSASIDELLLPLRPFVSSQEETHASHNVYVICMVINGTIQSTEQKKNYTAEVITFIYYNI